MNITSELDLNNIDAVLTHVTTHLEAYFKRLDTETDIDSLIKLGASLATISWFIGNEEAKAFADLEQSKALHYQAAKISNPDMTIPMIENVVRLNTSAKSLKARQLYNAMRSLNTFLTQLSIRIRNLRKEKLDTANPF